MALSRINNNSIANNTIVSADLAAGSVTGDKLGLTAINANNIVNSTITAAKLATGIAACTPDDAVAAKSAPKAAPSPTAAAAASATQTSTFCPDSRATRR